MLAIWGYPALGLQATLTLFSLLATSGSRMSLCHTCVDTPVGLLKLCPYYPERAVPCPSSFEPKEENILRAGSCLNTQEFWGPRHSSLTSQISYGKSAAEEGPEWGLLQQETCLGLREALQRDYKIPRSSNLCVFAYHWVISSHSGAWHLFHTL